MPSDEQDRRPSSSAPFDDLWGTSTEATDWLTSTESWTLGAMMVETALARALEESGIAPELTVRAAASAWHDFYPYAELPTGVHAQRARVAGTPAIPFVEAFGRLAEQMVAGSGAYIHLGATSQDLVDTVSGYLATCFVARERADSAARIAAAFADAADAHRGTVVAGRTLLQQGAPTSFGLVAAGWLVAFVDAWAGLVDAARAMPAQLGGPVGTLGALGTRGVEVHERFAAECQMPEAVVPWHTNRLPVARLASALAMLAGVVGKIAGDITLHAQTEIGELSERSEPGRGTSSAMPHKRNQVASVRALAAARQVAPIAGGILASMADHPFQRAVGAWQAEVPALNAMYGFVAVALESLADALDGLHVDVDRMRANLDPRGGWSAEAATVALTPHVGREAARASVTAASDAARANGTALLDELRAALAANDAVPADALDAAGDPATLLGSSGIFIDRALAHYRESALHP